MRNKNFLWWRDGIIYQIYPRSFADSNGDGIGDLPGIISHLDYLADLAIDAIWLSPIFPSPDADFGYDVANYTAIDRRMGTLDDFDCLVREAHKLHIHIILDMVLNHTSDQHPWFQASRSSRDNPYHDWYIWKDPRSGHKPPNNWKSVVGGKAWKFVPDVEQYYYHTYFQQQPDLNWRNPEVKKSMLDVIRFWLERGVDGYRLDVFNAIFKHADFPDNPPFLGLRGYDRQLHLYDRDQPELFSLLAEIRKILDSCPERYMVGEPMFSGVKQIAKFCGKDLLHQAFDFKFLQAPYIPGSFRKAILRWEEALPADAWPCYVLNNHDEPRSASRFHDEQNDSRSKIAATLLLTLRGTPFIYYGEEIGMRNIHLSRKQILDPLGKPYWPLYKGRDGCRSPMQWNASLNAGFSSGTPWIPLNADYLQRNVIAQQSQPGSLLDHYRSLSAIRHQIPALQNGSFMLIRQHSRHVLAYIRQSGSESVLVALNFSGLRQNLTLEPGMVERDWKPLISSLPSSNEASLLTMLELQPYEARLFLSYG